jgi:uncharacterized protein YbjT (DUF2867 family)
MQLRLPAILRLTGDGCTGSMTNTTLLIGGTGKTGRRVAERLTARGLDVRLGSRRTAVPFDWDDTTTWGPALAGVRAAYVTFHPDLAIPGAAGRVGALARLAAAHGVRQLVLLSGRGEPEAEAAERAVQEAGTGWTIVSCSWFNQNFSEDFLVDAVLAGEIMIPAGDMVEPFVDADDIADVVVAALTDPRHQDRRYELTGPRALSFADVAAELSRATGRTITYTPVGGDEYRGMLREQGLPVELGDVFTKVLDGRNAAPVDGVRQALGRPAKDFRTYAGETAATGIWKA